MALNDPTEFLFLVAVQLQLIESGSFRRGYSAVKTASLNQLGKFRFVLCQYFGRLRLVS